MQLQLLFGGPRNADVIQKTRDAFNMLLLIIFAEDEQPSSVMASRGIQDDISSEFAN